MLRGVLGASLPARVWSYLGEHQVKLTRSYQPERWLTPADGPDHDERTRQALAETAALAEVFRG